MFFGSCSNSLEYLASCPCISSAHPVCFSLMVISLHRLFLGNTIDFPCVYCRVPQCVATHDAGPWSCHINCQKSHYKYKRGFHKSSYMCYIDLYRSISIYKPLTKSRHNFAGPLVPTFDPPRDNPSTRHAAYPWEDIPFLQNWIRWDPPKKSKPYCLDMRLSWRFPILKLHWSNVMQHVLSNLSFHGLPPILHWKKHSWFDHIIGLV